MRTRTLLLAPAALAAGIALAGCTAIGDAVNRESSAEFDSVAQLELNWGKTAPWLPDDAVDIRVRESTAGDPAVLAASTASPLDPADCV